jgi:hypothetical protein
VSSFEIEDKMGSFALTGQSHLHPRNDFFFLIFCGMLYAALVIIIPPYFSLIDSDSAGYIEFSKYRTALYPIFLRMLTWAGLEMQQIAYVQLLIFSVALMVLSAALLRTGVPRLLILVLVLLLGLNGYFSSFHLTILTESLFFSTLVIAAALLIDYLRTGRIGVLAGAGLFVGIGIGLRPVGVLLVPIIPLAAWLKWHRRNVSIAAMLAALILPVALGPAVERLVYRDNHGDQQGSVLFLILLGKAAMVTGPDTAFTGPNAEALNALGRALYETYAPVRNYLSRVPSIVAWPVMTGHYEALAQGQVILNELAEWSGRTGLSVEVLTTELGKQAILKNLPTYIRLTFTHYLGQWSVTALTFPPASRVVNEYTNTSGIPLQGIIADSTVHPPASLRSYIVYPAFAIAGGVTVILSLMLIAFIVRPRLGDHGPIHRLMLAGFFAATAQVYTLLISFINLSTPRFLMAVYPNIVLSGLFLLLAVMPRRAVSHPPGR